jgi:phosphonate transport system substrate-binding protein
VEKTGGALMRKYIFLLALALIISGHSGIALAQQGSFSTLRIGTTNYTGKLDNIWEVLLSHLQIKLGIKCSLVKAKDIIEIQNLLKSKQIEFAFLTPADYLSASKQPGLDALAIQLLPDGSPGYYAVLVTKKSSGITTLDQAKGKSLGLVTKDSVSGFQVQGYVLQKSLSQPLSALFSKTSFAGTHIGVISGLQKGAFEVGATNTKDLKNSCKIMNLDPAQFNIIWKSELIPESIFAARKDLPPGLKKNFAEALFSMNSEKKELEAINIGGYARPKEEYFSLIKGMEEYLSKQKILY